MSNPADIPAETRSDPATHVEIPAAVLAEHVRGWLSERYEVPVVRVGEHGSVEVPAGNALTFARERAFEAGVDPATILPLDADSLVWLTVPREGVILWRRHGHRDEQVTDLVAGDPAVQVVHGHEGWELVRTVDGAQGWMPQRTWEPGERPNPRPPSTLDPAQLVSAAGEHVGVPYMWGGTTPDGMDCSGLVQRSAWQSAGVWLPRHSTAMLKTGRRVSLDAHQPGDIIVLRRRPEHREPGMRGTSHVGIVTGNDTFLHASPHAGEVVSEPLTAVLERYQPLGTRRFGATDG